MVSLETGRLSTKFTYWETVDIYLQNLLWSLLEEL